MPRVVDVAKYILGKTGRITSMKLQKLMYYAQAWSLVWEEAPLFDEDFQAWANGPVLPSLYQTHRGMFEVDVSLVETGNALRLNDEQRDTVNRVVDFYGKRSAQQLSTLTHREQPWREARDKLPPLEPCINVITKASMHEFYASL